MFTTKVAVVNLREVSRALRNCPLEMRRELKDAMKGLAEIAAARARTKAPKRSGRLASSIKAYGTTSGAKVGARLVYAPIIEFGRKALHPGHGHTNTHLRTLRPQKYMIPAVRETAPEIGRIAGPAIKRALDKAMRDQGLRNLAHG